MIEDLSFTIESEPNIKDIYALTQGIFENTLIKRGESFIQPLAIMVRDNQEKLVGGIFGSMFYGCLHIDQIWVKPALQQQGIGRKLMQNAEEQARQIGCRIITVNTMTWEAKDFYKKLGFEVEFKRPGYDFDGEMIHLKKQL